MANLNNEHLEMICTLQYRDLKLSNMGKHEFMRAQDLIAVGLVAERAREEGEVLSIRYLHLTEKGQSILEQLELELNRAVMK